MKKLAGFIFVILISVTPCFAATYYVSPTGNDLAAGSSSTPWKTIQKCANVLNPGDTCVIKNGIYPENIVAMKRSGSAFSPITFRAENVRQAVLKGRINLTADYVKIYGLNIILQTNHQFGVSALGTGNEIRNCSFDGGQNVAGMNNTAVVVNGTSSIISNNYIQKSCFGISITGKNHIVENNEVTRLKMVVGSCGDVDYIRFFGPNHILKNNKLYGIVKNEVGTAHVDCFQSFDNNGLDRSIQNVTIEGNFCSDASEGIILEGNYFKSSNEIIVRNNVFKNVGAWGIVASNIKNLRVFNNTFDMTGGIHGTGCRNGSSCEFKNNIYFNGNSLYWFENSTIIDGTAAAPGKNNVLYRQGVTVTGYAGDVKNKDPLFVDRVNDNYRLQSSSPAISAGSIITTWKTATDKDGLLRPQTIWSAGAYQSSSTTQSSSSIGDAPPSISRPLGY